jgi:N12 class adenine-specific DNA methylase/phospholipid N-methyltransferase
MRDSISGVNLYVSIGDSALGGSHPQHIQIMYRATTKQDDKQASGFGRENSGNRYISPSTSAFELAEVLDNLVTDLAKSNQVSSTQQEVESNDNERSTDGSQDPSGAPTARSGRGEPGAQHANAPRNPKNVESPAPTDGSASGKTGDSGRSSLRGSGKNVGDAGHVREIGDATNGRTGTSRDGTLDAGTRGRELESNAGVKSTAQDFYMSDPLSIIGGTPAKRFDKNVKALELLEDLQSEGRQATPEEQAVLAAYSGWGSFGQELFQGSWEKPVYKDEGVWKERGNWLRSHLGEKSWKSAQNSITNAHYTDPHTVQAMWSMVEKMGFNGGKVLEPAMGTGNFISLMPQSLKQRSQVTGIELDITTSQIAKQLFPSSNIQQLDYRDSKTPDSFYDLVITNVPFANIKMADRRYNQFNPSLHDYFFLKAIDQVREGGIVMAITSSTTMDKKGQVIRRELARKAELITSIRLPSGAFKDYAGTSVVTDIIVLRKRAEPLSVLPNDLNWIGTQEVATPAGTPVEVNQFYAKNPKNILGTLNFGAGTTFGRAGMIVDRPGNLLQRLETVAALAPDNALLPRNHEDHLTYYANKTGERHNALTLVDGELMYAMGDQLVKAEDLKKYQLKDEKKTEQRRQSIHDLINLRKKLVDLIDAQRSNATNVEDLRKATYQAYKGYVKQHGGLRDSYGLQYFKNIGDVFYFELAALEDANGQPATILERSTVRGKTNLKKPTVTDAFVIARNTAIQPNLKQIANLAKVTEQQAKQILIDKGAIFELPNGDITPTDLYLSGNVRQKLREAKAALEQGNASMQSNIDALQKVIPKDIPYFNIETKLGATWIPTKDYADFVAHMLNTESSSDIKIEFKSGRWYVNLKSHLLNRTEARSNYGTQDVKFNRLVQAALSNQIITIKRKDPEGGTYVDMKSTQEIAEKINKIKADFAAWVWGDPERKLRLEQEYNETMNAWATPQYDGSFMSMEGMALELGNSPFNLRQHQQNSIWRAIVNKRSINAHEVGTGKTFTMGGIAIESRRYGIAKKPLLLAHNANSASVAAEIRMMYPNARVLYVADMSGINRQIRLRQIANDDWDVVVMPHSMIDKLSLSEETLMQLAQEDIAALEQEFFEAMSEDSQSVSDFDFDNEEAINKLRSPTAKEVAKARQSIIESIKKQAQQASKADAILFENLGVDMLLVDEVHEFKKPPIVTRMAMKGLNKGTSQRSIQLQFLTRYIRGMNNGNNIHTFTGTPITNTITEIYHQMRYVMEDEMKKLNIADWDGWFNSFATEVEDVELTSAGDYELVTRLAGFVNVPELRKLVGQFMDTVFAEDMPEMQPRKTSTGKTINDPSLTDKERAHLMNGRTEGAVDRPYKRIMNDTAEMTNEQEQLFSYLQDLSKEWRMATGKQKKEWMRKGDEHSPIVVEGRANKASLDVRIDDAKNVGMEGQTQDNPNSKASRVVKNVLEVFKSHPQANQVIFTETGYNTSAQRSTGTKDANGKTIKETVKTFSTVKDIVERLVQGGIPKDKIAIVDGSTSKEKRKEIADKMNKSEIRVVIGSTQTLGVGVNMQRNLRAMHHLDAPYMTGDLEQRNGRGLRQGNQWNTVLEYRYITDRLDGKRWQILAVKQRFINAFMKSNGMTRNIEGEAAEDEQNDILESLSEASGDPRILMRVKLKKKLENLQRKERIYSQGLVDMKQTITSEGRKLERVNQLIQDMEDAQAIQKTSDLLKSQADNFLMKVDGKTYTVRKDAEEAIKAYVDNHIRMGQESTKVGEYAGHPIRVFWSSLQTQPTYTMSAFGQEHSANTLRGLETSLRSLPKELGKLNKSLSNIQSTISSLREAIKQPFGQANELVKVDKQLNDLNHDLELNPVPAPVWLRQGTPVDSEVYRGGQLFIVTGHKYAQDGWYVLAEDAKGQTAIPYMEATDNNGMPVYEEHEFVPPNVEKKQPKKVAERKKRFIAVLRTTNAQRQPKNRYALSWLRNMVKS